MTAKLTKAERRIADKFKVMHMFRVAKTKEEYDEAVAASKEFCQKYNIKFNRLWTFPELVTWRN